MENVNARPSLKWGHVLCEQCIAGHAPSTRGYGTRFIFLNSKHARIIESCCFYPNREKGNLKRLNPALVSSVLRLELNLNHNFGVLYCDLNLRAQSRSTTLWKWANKKKKASILFSKQTAPIRSAPNRDIFQWKWLPDAPFSQMT